MAKKSLILMLIGLFVIWVAAASATGIKSRLPFPVSKTAKVTRAIPITGDEQIEQLGYHPTQPSLIASSPGDTVGWTQYDYQSNGSSGNRIALDSHGNVHVDWMHGRSGITGTARSIDYNYWDSILGWEWPGGPSPTGGEESSHARGAGYGQIALTTDDRAVLSYHRATLADSQFAAIDGFEGTGAFTYHGFTTWFGAAHCLWPYVSVDRNGRIHQISSQSVATGVILEEVGYRRSSDGGATWSTAALVDTTSTISAVVTSSPVSDKVAIVYTRQENKLDSTQWKNDVIYVQSTDGVTWDFAHGKVNVTNYGTDQDSIWAYTDCDAVYDYNDNLHIIWNAQYITPDSGFIGYLTHLEHYSTGTHSINEICHSDSTFISGNCAGISGRQAFGAWNWSIAKMSIGSDPQNDLFVTWTGWSTLDIAADQCANGDIYMNYSNDDGATWTLRGNLTNSRSDSCAAGDCDSDHWSSLAEKVDNNLHILYVNDKDAGGIPQSEGSITDNPMLYMAYPNPASAHAIPSAPELVFPGNAYSDTFNAFVFEWGDPVGVLHYDIQVDDNQDFSSPLFTDNNVQFYQWINPSPFPVGTYYWHVKSVGYYGESSYSPTWSFTVLPTGPVGCVYIPGDINGNGSVNGVDIVFAVNYFKGGANHPPVDCFPACPNEPNPFYGAGDVNGNCAFNGIDITFFVRYLKGQVSSLLYCTDCPPATP